MRYTSICWRSWHVGSIIISGGKHGGGNGFLSVVSRVDLIMKHTEEKLVLRRRGGGNVIEQCPVFSLDAEILYTVCGSVIRAYGVRTGELVSEYERLKGKVTGVQLHPSYPNVIVACSEKGELIQWSCSSRLPSSIVCLKFKNKRSATVTGFHFLSPSPQESESDKCVVCVVWKKSKRDVSQLSTFCSQTGSLLLNLKFQLDDHAHNVAYGGKPGEEYVAGIHKNMLQFIDAVEWKQCDKQYIGGGRWFTCVACHPEERCIATGDNTGRVLIWWNLLTSGKPTWAVYHWHTLPVQAVTFSQTGSHFYSGAGECVLVKWTLNKPLDRSFLPRLPNSICHLSVAPDNKCLAISTSDNGIQIVDPQLKLISVIQHFTWQVEVKHGLPLFPAGISVDPRTKALVMNGRTGHIQFYSPHTGTLLYNLDITQMNYLTQERNNVIVNTDVTKVSLNCNGEWMATVEERDDRETNMEVRLKFWNYDSVKQSFCLNTSVELPHIGGVLSVGFQPSPDLQQQLAVTAGRDLKFRIWSLVESSSIYKKGIMVWRCESVGFFRNLPIGDTGFSADGSLLAVTFGPTLTVWVPETNQLKCSLTELHSKINLSHVQFGMVDCGHLVVTGSSVNINVWHLLTLSLVWTVPIHVSILTADPYSEFMAVFTLNNDLFVFSPRCSKPLYIHKNIVPGNCSILCAAFVPRFSLERSSGIPWQENSHLYFLDSNQELLTLERPCEDANVKEGLALPISTLQPVTFFSTLLAKHRSSDVEKLHIDTQQQLGDPGASAIRELLSAPAYTIPPMNLLCGPILRSLVASSSKQIEEKKTNLKERKKDKADRMETKDSGVDSEDETSGHELLKQREVKDDPNKIQTNDLTMTINIADVESRLASVLEEKFDWTAVLLHTDTACSF